jgi:hypothetical protein
VKTKQMLLGAALMAALIAIAAAQDNRLPQASLDREVGLPAPVRLTVSNNPPPQTTPPSYCKPCLFYAGDWDSDASDANGLANEVDTTVSTGAAVYAPFIVPKGEVWTVTGLFTDNFLWGQVLDPVTTPYEIRKGIPRAGGNGGTLVCHGRKPATLTDTGVTDWIQIYATKVEHIKGCRLHAGKYWMSVVPYCTNASKCNLYGDYRGFEANDDGAMAHRFGPLEPANNSFFNSVYFGAVWEPSSKQQTSSRFSDGVEGTSKPDNQH